MTLWYHTLELVCIGFVSLFKSPDGNRNVGIANVNICRITFTCNRWLLLLWYYYQGISC